MSDLLVNRIVTCVETGQHGVKRAWSAAVVSATSDAHSKSDLTPFVALGEQLGDTLARHAIEAMGCRSEDCCCYGKGAIVGDGAEMEQGAALLHPKLGRPLRQLIGKGKAIIPSTIKRGAIGAHLDVPLHGADDEWDFALLDAIEAFVPGAPRRREIVVVVALATGGRPAARVIKGQVL